MGRTQRLTTREPSQGMLAALGTALTFDRAAVYPKRLAILTRK
jgi:hypothetical protein